MLVTGASGFVGTALCNDLRARGLPLRPVSRRPDGDSFVIGTVDENTNWSEALRGVSRIVHLAARVHVMNDRAADPLMEFRRANVAATLRLARQAAAEGVERFVFVSSVKVNGEDTTGRQPFTASDPARPEDPYGVSKCEAEEGLWRLSRETGLEVVVVRPPLVYGPGVKANFQRLMLSVRGGLPLPFGSVLNRRSMVYLGNLVDLLRVCAVHPAAAGQTFMVSDGEDLSTAELVRRLAAAMGRTPHLLPCPPGLLRLGLSVLGRGQAARRLLGSLQVDIRSTREALDWHPPYSVDEGLLATVRSL